MNQDRELRKPVSSPLVQMDRQFQESWPEAAGRPGGVARYVLRLPASEPQMYATRREERAGRTRGSQLVTFLNVPPSLASFSQSLPTEAIDAGPGRFGGRGEGCQACGFKWQGC